MSCVVGIADGKHVWMGADSQITDNDRKYIDRSGKIAKHGDMLIGGVGGFRTVQKVIHLFNRPTHKVGNDLKYICGKFVTALIKFTGNDRDDDDDSRCDASFLVGYNGRLYVISGDWAVVEPAEQFSALGFYDVMGVLWATVGQKPEDRIELALQAAAAQCAFVSPPFVVLKI